MKNPRPNIRRQQPVILPAVLLMFTVLTGQQWMQAGADGNPRPAIAVAGRIGKSPIETFRELLAMTPEERAAVLATKPAATREGLRAKLNDYDALTPNDRELRLQATELHWYLTPMMKMSPAERQQRLAQIPPEMRELVQQRLQILTILPPPLSDELLDNQPILSLLLMQPQTNTAAIVTNLPPAQRATLDAGIARWQAMPENQRRQICQQFLNFFDLSAQEKDKALSTLSDAERQQMDKTLREFEKLPKAQREICMMSFQQFTGMTLAERNQFIQNAEHWQQMTPDERRVWRDLVTQVPNWPPLPPGYAPAPLPRTN